MDTFTFNFRLLHGQLRILVRDVISSLEKEPREKIASHLPLICEFYLKIASNNYDAVRRLVTKDYKFSAPAKVICKSTIDMVFTLCLIMSNPSKYVSLYLKSGWRKKYEPLLGEQTSDYMKIHSREWLGEYEQFIELAAKSVDINDEEREHFEKSLIYFPTAPQMTNPNSNYYKEMDDLTRQLLEKLMKEYYRPLSQIVHVSDPGFALHAVPLVYTYSPRNQEIIKSEPILIMWMAMLCLLSEINIAFRYKFGQKLKEFWTYLGLTIPLHNEIYSIKYKSFLS